MHIGINGPYEQNRLEELNKVLVGKKSKRTMYCAVLIAPDGDWVTDFNRESVKEVWGCVNDMGSKWIFYPYIVVVESTGDINNTLDSIIVDGGEDLPMFLDKDIRFLSQAIANKEV